MTNRWMITAAAAALIAGTGFAYAQGSMGHEGGAAGGTGMQHQSAPASPGASGHEREGSAGMKSSQTEEKGGAAKRSAQQETKGAQKGTVGQSSATEKSSQEKSAQDTKGDRSKGMSSENEEKGAAGKKAESTERKGNMKAEERNERNGNMKAEGKERSGNMKAEERDRTGNMKAEERDRSGSTTTATEGNRTQTTGQAGAGAKLSGEQRTRITSIIHEQHVAPVNNINFAVSVGTRVPRDIGFHPLPTEIVSIYPEWRGYEFFLVRDEIVVVDPRTLEIVDVLPA
jgi:Protein of unknown function (DUF1236)